MPCYDELNKQIKSLQSRITQAEDDINAHYVGLSQLVTDLLADPFTSGPAAASAVIYNFSPVGMKLLRELLNAFIPSELQKTMRLLTMLSAASIDDIAEGIVTGAAASALGMVNNGIDAVTQEALNELNSIQNELYNLDPNNILQAGANSIINNLKVSGDSRMLHQKTLMQEALSAWQHAVAAPIGEFTQDAITDLRRSYLEQAKLYYQMQAGIAGAFATVNGVIGQSLQPTHEINAALKELNGILGFLVIQDDMTNCKSTGLRLGG